MIMQYGNFAYFFYPILIVGFTVGMYFLLRKRSERLKQGVLLAMMLVNLVQHFLKQYVYPHYWGTQIDFRICTAYNLCALLIIGAPFVLLSKNKVLKDFFVLFGTNAGVVTMAVPYWYIGQTVWQWDVFRYYFCHGLLSSGALLTALLGLHKLNWRNFWKMPFIFFLSLILICFNDIIVYAVQGANGNLWDVLYSYNPCWLFHPAEEFAWLVPVFDFFSPDAFIGDFATGKQFTPLLWYLIPMFLLIAILALIIEALTDRKRFMKDMRAFKAWAIGQYGRAREFWARHRHKAKAADNAEQTSEAAGGAEPPDNTAAKSDTEQSNGTEADEAGQTGGSAESPAGADGAEKDNKDNAAKREHRHKSQNHQ